MTSFNLSCPAELRDHAGQGAVDVVDIAGWASAVSFSWGGASETAGFLGGKG